MSAPHHPNGSSVSLVQQQSGNRSVSASQIPVGGITRSSHVSHSQQSPLVASNSSGPLSSESEAAIWTLDRVINYLDRHEFSKEWQQAFRNLNIHGQEFLDMGHHSSTSLLERVQPEVLRICGQHAEPAKERQAAKNIKKMVREMLKLTKVVPNTPPSSSGQISPQNRNDSFSSAERGESPSKQPHLKSPVQTRFNPNNRSTTLPVMHPDGSYSSSTEQPPYTRGSSDSRIEQLHRPNGSDSGPKSRALNNVVDQVGRHSPSNSETSIREPQESWGYSNFTGKQPISNSPRNSPSLGYQTIPTHRHEKSNSTESIASSINNSMMNRAGDGKGTTKALQVLGVHPKPVERQDTHEKSRGTKIVDKIRRLGARKESKDDESMDDVDSPTSPGWRSAGVPFSIAEHNASDSSLDRHSISSVDVNLRGRQKVSRAATAANGVTGAANQRKFVFATKDGRIWVLVEVTKLDTVESLRKMVCAELGIGEWDIASIHQTEVGQGANLNGTLYSPLSRI